VGEKHEGTGKAWAADLVRRAVEMNTKVIALFTRGFGGTDHPRMYGAVLVDAFDQAKQDDVLRLAAAGLADPDKLARLRLAGYACLDFGTQCFAVAKTGEIKGHGFAAVETDAGLSRAAASTRVGVRAATGTAEKIAAEVGLVEADNKRRDAAQLAAMRAAGEWEIAWVADKSGCGETRTMTFDEVVGVLARHRADDPITTIRKELWTLFMAEKPHLGMTLAHDGRHALRVTPPACPAPPSGRHALRVTPPACPAPPSGRHVTEAWRLTGLDTGYDEPIHFDKACVLVEADRARNGERVDTVVGDLAKAYADQTAVTISMPGKSGEWLVVPPDKYPADQQFVCQECRQKYLYGNAKNLLSTVGSNYPAVFCSNVCRDKFRKRTGRNFPAVGAEIPLGETHTVWKPAAMEQAFVGTVTVPEQALVKPGPWHKIRAGIAEIPLGPAVQSVLHKAFEPVRRHPEAQDPRQSGHETGFRTSHTTDGED